MISLVNLNNKGVLLLESGNFVDAARYFKQASKMLISVISLRKKRRAMMIQTTELPFQKRVAQQNGAIAIPSTSARLPKPTGSLDIVQPHLNDLVDHNSRLSQQRRHRPRNVQGAEVSACDRDEQLPPTKKCRTTRSRSCIECITSTSSSVSRKLQHLQGHNFGRPLWVRSEQNKNASLDYTNLSATLFYNLGLCFNLRAVVRQKQRFEEEVELNDSRSLFEGSLKFYKMAVAMMTLRGPSSSNFPRSSVVLAVALHNTILVHAILNEPDASAKCRGHLAHLLRLAEPPSKRISDKGYESYLMRLLAVPNDTDVATAA